MGDFNLNSVNWQDGMLINQHHLKSQNKYIEELSRWYAARAGDSYGLVRRSTTAEALTLNVTVNGANVHVEVVRCQAVTSGGYFIEISELSRNTISAEVDMGGESIPIYIAVNPESKIQVGDPDPDEDVPRIPYLSSAYFLHLGQPPNFPMSNFLQIGLLVSSGDGVVLSENYYPPSMTLFAHEKLTELTRNYKNKLDSLLALTSRAYGAVVGGSMSGERTELQTALKDTIYQYGIYLSTSLDSFVVGKNSAHPIELIVYFKKLFRVFSTLLNFQPGLKDYLNEKFFSKELNSELGTYMSAVDNFLLAEYNHQNVAGHIRAINENFEVLRGIFGYLAQVDKDQLGDQAVATDTVTYQGKTYRMVEFAGCRVEEASGLCYLLINIPKPQPISDMVTLLVKDMFTVEQWNSMQVRLGLNEARGLGETDPVKVDTTTYGNKVAFWSQDMVKSASVNQVNLIFRGTPDISKFDNLGKTDLIVYAV